MVKKAIKILQNQLTLIRNLNCVADARLALFARFSISLSVCQYPRNYGHFALLRWRQRRLSMMNWVREKLFPYWLNFTTVFYKTLSVTFLRDRNWSLLSWQRPLPNVQYILFKEYLCKCISREHPEPRGIYRQIKNLQLKIKLNSCRKHLYENKQKYDGDLNFVNGDICTFLRMQLDCLELICLAIAGQWSRITGCSQMSVNFWYFF